MRLKKKTMFISFLVLFSLCMLFTQNTTIFAADQISVSTGTTETDNNTENETENETENKDTPDNLNPDSDTPSENINRNPSPIPTTKKAGWEYVNNKWKYYDSKKYLTNCVAKISGSTYSFNAKGYLQTGFVKKNDNIYYFKRTGKAGQIGKMLTGLKKIDGNHYYFKASGKMVTGWKNINNKMYYFKKTGKLGAKGKALTGWQKISGKKFYFTSSGKLAVGLKKIGKHTYYFRNTSKKAGKMGCVMTGWQKIKGKEYYFYPSGKMAKNTYIDGYEITNNGTLSQKATALRKKVKSLTTSFSRGCTTKEQVLRKCFFYLANNYSYKSDHSLLRGTSAEMAYAYELLMTGKGNCYKFAAAFAYLARELGYNPTCIWGHINGSTTIGAPHGWVEIKIGGVTYLFDPDLQLEFGNKYNYNFFKLTYESAVIRYIK